MNNQNAFIWAKYTAWAKCIMTLTLGLAIGDLTGCSDAEPKPEPECTLGTQCKSGVCTNETCQLATCLDMTQNQNETDIDCGGLCRACDIGRSCKIHDDCSSKLCSDGTCAERKGLGDACEEDQDCNAEFTCTLLGKSHICTLNCVDSCPNNYACYQGQCAPPTFCDDPDNDGIGAGPGCTKTICDTCDTNAACVMQNEFSFSCICNEGFTGDGAICTDFDECKSGTNTCGDHATCTNTAPGFMCACDSGFEGDGTVCTDIDECATNKDNCDPAATCTNLPGGFLCTCPTGSTDTNGNGTSCSAVDECALNTDTCHSDATCTDTANGFDCTCNTGFSDANPANPGHRCQNTNECLNGMSTCVQNATCRDTQGSYECNCPTGFSGDGKDTSTGGTGCSSGDPCQGVTCGTNSECIATSTTTHMCICVNGYMEQNGSCVDNNECTNGSSLRCHALATCVNTPGGYTCDCPAGYEDVNGDGSVCSNINECKNGTDNCSPNATCTDSEGSFTCTCDSGYVGTGTSCRRPVSCLELKQTFPSTSSGMYTINTNKGEDTQVYCDMDTEGGGYTMLKIKTNSALNAAQAEQACQAKGMHLFIPRTPQHLQAAYSLAINSNIAPGGDPNYLRILGIYPNHNGATCLRRALRSGSSGCNWKARDGERYFVSDRTNITEPNGDNHTSASMYYGWASGSTASISWYNDIPNPGYTSNTFMCDTSDKK